MEQQPFSAATSSPLLTSRYRGVSGQNDRVRSDTMAGTAGRAVEKERECVGERVNERKSMRESG